MLMPQGGTQSGGAVYRRVVIRNIVCTTGIALMYMVNTSVIVLVWLEISMAKEKVYRYHDFVGNKLG